MSHVIAVSTGRPAAETVEFLVLHGFPLGKRVAGGQLLKQKRLIGNSFVCKNHCGAGGKGQ